MARPKKKTEKKEIKNEIKSEVPFSPPSLSTTMATPQDRMVRYKKPSCPECGSFPLVTEQSNKEMAVYRCRQCGFRFEDCKR